MARAKNPYELRLEILYLARDILSENAHAEREIQDRMREFCDGGGTIVPLDDEGHPTEEMASGTVSNVDLFDPCTFTPEDVLEEAAKLYGFICLDGDPCPTSGKP